MKQSLFKSLHIYVCLKSEQMRERLNNRSKFFKKKLVSSIKSSSHPKKYKKKNKKKWNHEMAEDVKSLNRMNSAYLYGMCIYI